MRILIVEDDQRIADDLVRALDACGYLTVHSSDGEAAEFLGSTEEFDAVILDLGLPKLDGLSVLKRWREQGITTPVLVLTARGTWQDKVEGIDAGGDDYLAKPFQIEELLARLRSIVRRASGHASSKISCGGVVLDARTTQVSERGTPLSLTTLEYRMLNYLMHNQGRVVSRVELTDHIYEIDSDRDGNTLDVLVGRLRRKLRENIIHTRRGHGYVLDSDS
ncbi:MAG: response regulator transcription factor [Hyphomicrobiales bacterium]